MAPDLDTEKNEAIKTGAENLQDTGTQADTAALEAEQAKALGAFQETMQNVSLAPNNYDSHYYSGSKCPWCGRCPHCGQPYPNYYPYPYYQPYYPQWPYTDPWYNGAGGSVPLSANAA